MAVLLFLIVGALRFGDAQWTTMWQAWNIDAWVGAVVYAAAWVAILWSLGLYAFRVRWTIAAELNDIVVASLLLTFVTISFLYLVKLDISRLFLLIVFVAQPVVTIGGRLALRLVFNWLRARGRNRCFMIVIGVGDEAQAFADAVENHRELGIEVVGHLRAPAQDDGVVTRPILGDANDLGRIFHEQVVDEVGTCVESAAAPWTESVIRLAASEGKNVRDPTRAEPRTLDLQIEELDGMLVRSYVHGPTRLLGLAVKRAMDVSGAVVGLVLLSPVLAVVAVALLVRDGRPILYHHTRVACTADRSSCTSSARWSATRMHVSTRFATSTSGARSHSRRRTTRGSLGSVGSSGRPAWTSSRSSGMCSRAR